MAGPLQKSLAEQRANAMADKGGFVGEKAGYRPYYVIGVMGECALSLERVLAQIASGEVQGKEARMLAQYALDDLRPRQALAGKHAREAREMVEDELANMHSDLRRDGDE